MKPYEKYNFMVLKWFCFIFIVSPYRSELKIEQKWTNIFI